jgi:hypothetical protein
MPIYRNINGTWTIVKHVWRNVGGTWTKVRKAFRNVGGTWTQYHGDNDFTIYSMGLRQTIVDTGLIGVNANGVHLYAGARSYNLVYFDKYGNITFSRTYDIFGESTAGAPTAPSYGSAQFAADVAAMPAGQLFLVFTYDEPKAGVDTAPLLPVFVNAMLSIGATTAVLESPNFQMRSAYMLLGQQGQPISFEANRGTLSTNLGSNGTDSGCLDGVVGITLNIVNGVYTNLVRIQ